MCTISKRWQDGFKLSTKHPSEINNKFENSYLKSIIYLENIKPFYTIPIKIFCDQNKTGLKLIAVIRFDLFWDQLDRQK